MTIRTRPGPDEFAALVGIHEALEDIACFIEATKKCEDLGVYSQDNDSVIAMLKHLQAGLAEALELDL